MGGAWLAVVGLLLVGCSQPHGVEDTHDPFASVDSDVCDNGLDDDGDGQVDEGCPCAVGDEQACYGGPSTEAGIGACSWGTQRCNADGDGGLWGECLGWIGPAVEEVCDGVDNTCDGEVDPGCACTPGEQDVCYDGPAGTVGVGACSAGFFVCTATEEGSEWSGCLNWVGPSEELCGTGADEDCDGEIDEGCACEPGETQACYGGPDNTLGVGECRAGEQTCLEDGDDVYWGPCEEVVLPAAEACEGGADEDCDDLVDCEDPDCEAACCEAYHEEVDVVPAEGELLFVVDRSGSMDWPAAGTTATRWSELLDAMTVTLPQVADMHLGLLTFPEMTGDAEQLWCGVAPGPDVPLGLGTGQTILSRLVAADPRAGDTPTPDALDVCQAYLDAHPTQRERFVILATDGLPEPNCGATVPATVQAIEALHDDGIDTFVLGIVGPDGDGDTSGIPALQAGLNDMADAGGRARTGAIRYYEANDGPALTSALEAILASATNCRFQLSTAPPGPVEVRIDGSLVPASGYHLAGTDLEFLGAYCSQIQSGVTAAITLADTCP